MIGSTANVSNASFQFTYSITTMMLRSVKKSPKIATTPEEKRSFSTSTSVVTRVTSRPTGLRSKKAISSRCKWRKICLRRSYITFCPTNCMANDCENSSRKLSKHGRKEEREGNLGDAHHGIAAQKMREEGWKVLAARGIQVAVHFHFHQVRRDGLKHSVKERGDEREQRHPPIRTKVLEQSPHQPRVVRFTDDLVFLVTSCHNSWKE